MDEHLQYLQQNSRPRLNLQTNDLDPVTTNYPMYHHQQNGFMHAHNQPGPSNDALRYQQHSSLYDGPPVIRPPSEEDPRYSRTYDSVSVSSVSDSFHGRHHASRPQRMVHQHSGYYSVPSHVNEEPIHYPSDELLPPIHLPPAIAQQIMSTNARYSYATSHTDPRSFNSNQPVPMELTQDETFERPIENPSFMIKKPFAIVRKRSTTHLSTPEPPDGGPPSLYESSAEHHRELSASPTIPTIEPPGEPEPDENQGVIVESTASTSTFYAAGTGSPTIPFPAIRDPFDCFPNNTVQHEGLRAALNDLLQADWKLANSEEPDRDLLLQFALRQPDVDNRHKCSFYVGGKLCGKVIGRSDRMLEHLRRHLGLRPFVCSCGSEGCPRTFPSKSGMQQHLKNLVPIDCERCKASILRQNMARHQRSRRCKLDSRARGDV